MNGEALFYSFRNDVPHGMHIQLVEVKYIGK